MLNAFQKCLFLLAELLLPCTEHSWPHLHKANNHQNVHQTKYVNGVPFYCSVVNLYQIFHTALH